MSADGPSYQTARRYAQLGWALIPIPFARKNPTLKGWTKLRLTELEIPLHFTGRENVGILLGEPSGGLSDVDLDCPEALSLAPTFLPETGGIFGRKSKPSSHRLYLCEPIPRTEPFKDLDGTMLVEIRSTGAQTIFPPSLADGEVREWVTDAEPAKIPGPTLRETVAKLAAAVFLARHWPAPGGRHEASLALAGLLLRCEWREGETMRFVGAIAQTAGDAEWHSRQEDVRSTGRRLSNNGAATGRKHLAELMGDTVVDRAAEWLGLRSGESSGARATAEVGVTKRLADAIRASNHFAQDAGGRLYRFSDGGYKPDGGAHTKRAVKKLLEEWNQSSKWSSARSEEVVEYLRVDAPYLWERPPLDRVNLVNGLLDVETRTLLPHSPDYLSPVQLPVMYDEAATCPNWESFVQDVFPEDAQELAWQIIAWLMRPDVSIQKAILLLGEGGNGKSTYLTGVTAFLGRSNVSAVSLHRLESDRFSVGRLVGKLANICPDLPSSHLAGTSTFKALTGGDAVLAEYKYKDSFEFAAFARLVFSANHAPSSSDSSHAFFRRWLVAPFSRTFEGGEEIRRPEMDARLANPRELSGVLNKALQALKLMQEQRGLIESESMAAAGEEFRRATDPVAVWLDSSTIEESDAFVSKKALLIAYNAAAEAAGAHS